MRMTRLYLSGRLYDLLIEPLVGNIRRYIERTVAENDLSPVLDICCGTGTQSHILKAGGNQVFGLDISMKAVRYAVWKNPHVAVICADAKRIPFKPAFFKSIVLSFSLHDKSPNIRFSIVEEAKRMLAPEGRIIFVDFESPRDKRSRWGSVPIRLIERAAGREHFRNYRDFLCQGGLRSLLSKHRLVEVSRKDAGWGNLAVVAAGKA